MTSLQNTLPCRPLANHIVTIDAALRQLTETETAKLRPPPIAMRLENLGYAEREIAQIRGMIEIFSHGNFPYLLPATIVRLLLEGEEMGRRDRSAAVRRAPRTGRAGAAGVDGNPSRRRHDASGLRGCEAHTRPAFRQHRLWRACALAELLFAGMALSEAPFPPRLTTRSAMPSTSAQSISPRTACPIPDA